ncbi:MAG: glycosyl hydrolase [Acidobacteria bacterium]|nr:glycosyl hydrolase [Acidobacteriota bacterium]
MQIEHKIGQLLFIGLPTTHVDHATRELLEQIQPGGVLLDKANIESAEQVVALTTEIRAILKVPPLLAVDQEGGRVDRLRDILSPMPSADLLRSSGDAATASRLGEITAEALRLLGFNMNFAPVLDLATDDAADNGLRGRYLGSAPGHVIALAGTYLEGLQRNGVIGVGKHFPGLGATTVDSHAALPQVKLSREELKERDLLPYLEMFSKINSRLVAVMIGHAHYAAYDGAAALPASISKNIVNGLLREELGFKGLAITDDLTMGAITATRSSGEAALLAIEAGVDLALTCGAPEQIFATWQTMVEAANNGRITKTHISRAFDHIARIKAMVSPPLPFQEDTIPRLRDAIAELNLSMQNSQ